MSRLRDFFRDPEGFLPASAEVAALEVRPSPGEGLGFTWTVRNLHFRVPYYDFLI